MPPLNSPVNPSQASTTTPKKSNWEVIEHFNTAPKGRGSVSSSLIAVRKCHTHDISTFLDFRIVQIGVTRFNMDGSGSNQSVSTANSPMLNRDLQQPFNGGDSSSSFPFFNIADLNVLFMAHTATKLCIGRKKKRNEAPTLKMQEERWALLSTNWGENLQHETFSSFFIHRFSSIEPSKWTLLH